MVKHLSDDQLKKLTLGGHDPIKVYNAYKAAIEHKGPPTVILARTIKGYGLGEAGEGKNITHQQKKMNEEELRAFRTRFGIPISDEQIADAPFYRPPEDSPEIQYIRERRKALGGSVPTRMVRVEPLKVGLDALFEEFPKGTDGRKASTTMVFVRMLAKLLRDKEIGKLIVPIVPDEARTFGMEALFRQVGIYSQRRPDVRAGRHGHAPLLQGSEGRPDPRRGHHRGRIDVVVHRRRHGLRDARREHDSVLHLLLDVRVPARRGSSSGPPPTRASAGSCSAARPGGRRWRARGCSIRTATATCTRCAIPNCLSYDPAFAYEIAVIIQDGIRRMYVEQESVFYYLTVMNEQYAMPEAPPNCREGILKGMYRFKAAEANKDSKAKLKAQLFGSGAILNEVVAAQEILAKYGVAADVWSVTSYSELYRDGHACERWNMLHPAETPRVPYVTQCLKDAQGVFVAASDYCKVLADSIDRWMPRRIRALGTDGFGRSEARAALREFFEVDARFVAVATLSELLKEGQIDAKVVAQAIKDLGINPDKPNPAVS